MCTVCGRQFHRSDYLKLHSFSHTDERPFYCQICGKGFKMNYNLKVHLKNHENERLTAKQIQQLQDESQNDQSQQPIQYDLETHNHHHNHHQMQQVHDDNKINEIASLLSADDETNNHTYQNALNLINDKDPSNQINNLISDSINFS